MAIAREPASAFLHLYYEFPLSEHAVNAEAPLQNAGRTDGGRKHPLSTRDGPGRAALRISAIFGGKNQLSSNSSRMPPAKTPRSSALRLAEIEYFQGRHGPARDALRPYLTSGARQAEARFFYLMTQHGSRDYPSFEQLVRALVRDFPQSTWAEEALNHLATYYIQQDQDDQADEVLREMYERFPKGRYADRAAWKAGWTSYRKRNMADTVRYFESAAVTFPRSDYRPAWLYWSGRAREAMDDRAGAIAAYRLTVADYENTYYGRLAIRVLKTHNVQDVPSNLIFAQNAAQIGAGEDDYFPPTEETIRTLLALGLYEPAVKELEFARMKWGDSPALGATLAWATQTNGRSGVRHASVYAGTRIHQSDEAGIPTVHGRWRRGAASRDPDDDFSAPPLGPDQEVFDAAQARSLPRCCIDGAGIDVRPGYQIARRCVRVDATDAIDRPPVRAQDEAALFAPAADHGGNERAD